MRPRRTHRWAILAILLVPATAGARDLELSLSLGSGYPAKPNLYLETQGASGTSSFVQTRFTGPWLLAGAHVNVEVYKVEAWKFWAGLGYEGGLGSPNFYKLGQATSQATTSNTEILNGSASYSRYQIGVGATLATRTLGEYGAYLWRRTHSIGLSGTVSTLALQGATLTPGGSGYSSHSTASDYMLELSMGFVQARPTCKTFQRISLGTAFGPGYGSLGAGDWKLQGAYNDRLRPTLEVHFAYGVRL